METLINLVWSESLENSWDTITATIIWIIIFIRLIAIIRTARDISARTENHFFQIISILLVTIIPIPIWLFIYIAIRPIWTIIRTNWSLNINASWALESSIIQSCTRCQNCWTLNPKEYKNCIKCGEKIKTNCKECNNEYPKDYFYCPFCGAPNIEK